MSTAKKNEERKSRAKANGEGTIYKIGPKKYKAVLIVGWADGKRITKTATASSKKQADEKLSELKVKYGHTIISNPQNTTLREWGILWLETFKVNSISESTHALYLSMWNTHIDPALGGKVMNKITPEECQRFLNHLFTPVEKGGKGLSIRTAEICRLILNQVLESALPRGAIQQNPCKQTILPPNRPKAKKVISNDILKKIFKEAQTYNGGSLFMEIALFTFTAMRISEVLALYWEDVDFHNDTIFVNAKIVDVGGNLSRRSASDDGDATKNGKSRSIPIAPPLKNILLSKYVSIIKDCHIQNLSEIDKTPIARPKFGKFKSPNNWRRAFRNFLKEEGMEKITPHQFRHTVATKLIDEGEDLITVSELLGHSSTDITAKVYVHEIAKRKRKAIKSISTILS